MSTRKVSFSTKIYYGFGRMVEGILYTSFSLFLLFYYTQVLGLSGSLAGIAIFIAQICDGVTDPLIGYISDNFRSRLGRRHPFMYASAIPLAICFYFLFTPPVGLEQTSLFLWLLFFTVATRSALTLFHVPHLALGAELSADYMERTSIASYRSLFQFVGIAGAAICSFTFFFTSTPEYSNGQMNPAAYPTLAIVFGIIILFVICISTYATQKEIPQLPKAPKIPIPFSFLKVFQHMLQALQNFSFRSIFLASIISYIGSGIKYTLLLHLGTYFWEFSSDQMTYILIGAFVGNFSGVLCTKKINQWIDKKATVVQAELFAILFTMLPIFLRLFGFFPANGDPLLLPLVIFFGVLQMFCSAQITVTLGSLIADIADEDELISGERREGIFYGAQSFIDKAVHGLGVSIAGISLDIISFPPHVEPGNVDPVIINHLGVLYGILPSFIALVAIYFYFRIRISRESHAKTLSKLEINRTKAK